MQSPDWIGLQTGKVHAGLKALAAQLGEHTFCYENTFSLADIAVGCALGWLDFCFPEIAWRSQYPNLAALSERLAKRPSFQETRPQ